MIFFLLIKINLKLHIFSPPNHSLTCFNTRQRFFGCLQAYLTTFQFFNKPETKPALGFVLFGFTFLVLAQNNMLFFACFPNPNPLFYFVSTEVAELEANLPSK